MEFIGTAQTVVGLLTLLKKVPNGAYIDISGIEHYMGVEVWYNSEINIVYFK
jgi:hypothetical protein